MASLPLFRVLTFSFTLTLILTAMISTLAEAQTKASCTFQLFNLPESTSSIAFGVNDSGTVVGSAPGAELNGSQGFMRTSSAKVTYYCAPGADCTAYNSFTYFSGINDDGAAAGSYMEPNSGVVNGFMLKGATFTSIHEPNSAFSTYASGINEHDTVIGYYYDSASNVNGFERLSNGSYTTLEYPGAKATASLGINNHSEIVGYYNLNTTTNGFTYRDGEWTTLNYPGASSTVLTGIDDDGVIIGSAGLSSGPGTAFIYESGAFKVIAVPNAYSTSVVGISADGLIVGMTDLQNSQSAWRGFTATCH